MSRIGEEVDEDLRELIGDSAHRGYIAKSSLDLHIDLGEHVIAENQGLLDHVMNRDRRRHSMSRSGVCQ